MMSETNQSHMTVEPDYELSQSGQRLNLRARGDWTLLHIGGIDERLRADIGPLDYENVTYDFSDVTSLDTSGAYLFARAIRCNEDICYPFDIQGGNDGQMTLMRAAADAAMGRPPATTRPWYDTLTRMGKATVRFWDEAYDTLAFLGQFLIVFIRLLLNPRQIRWKSVVALIEEVGLNAAPIIMLLSFFIGAVIAYMGANLLASFGAQIFMVELIGISVLREFAVLITAIMLAGRSDSAFTAQIGAMKMRQEIDAMKIIGLDTYETLVAPRAIACLVSAPILTFLAMISGIAGGLVVAWFGTTGISPLLFFARFQETIELKHFWVGMVKAPFFALIIAVIGCRQGLAVKGSVDSLGARTTSSVVQAIFTVIAIDAMFAILFYEMGV